jgi:hypothetical protein
MIERCGEQRPFIGEQSSGVARKTSHEIPPCIPLNICSLHMFTGSVGLIAHPVNSQSAEL